jgi:tetratricopeptide (TPR) repeat protein
MRARVLILLLGVIGAAQAAGPTAAGVARAKEEFRKAETYFRARDYTQAIDHYRKAYELSKLPKLLYNIGIALHLKGDKQAALEALQAYIAAEPTSKYVAEAQSEIAGLLQEIAAEGPRPRTTTERVPDPEPDTTVEPVQPKTPEPRTATTPTPPAPDVHVQPAVVSDPGRDSPGDDKSGVRLAGWVTAGVGVALLATGVVFGLKAKSAHDDLAAAGTWDPGLYDSGRAANRNMFIFLGAGAAAVATGAVLTFVIGRPADDRTVTVIPAPGGLLLQGRF